MARANIIFLHNIAHHKLLSEKKKSRTPSMLTHVFLSHDFAEVISVATCCGQEIPDSTPSAPGISYYGCLPKVAK